MRRGRAAGTSRRCAAPCRGSSRRGRSTRSSATADSGPCLLRHHHRRHRCGCVHAYAACFCCSDDWVSSNVLHQIAGQQVVAQASPSRIAFEVPARIRIEAIKPSFPLRDRQSRDEWRPFSPANLARREDAAVQEIRHSGHSGCRYTETNMSLRKRIGVHPMPSRDRGDTCRRISVPAPNDKPRLAGSHVLRGRPQRDRPAQSRITTSDDSIGLTLFVSTRKPSAFVSSRQFWAGRFR